MDMPKSLIQGRGGKKNLPIAVAPGARDTIGEPMVGKGFPVRGAFSPGRSKEKSSAEANVFSETRLPPPTLSFPPMGERESKMGPVSTRESS